MPRTTKSILINAPIEKVHKVVADFENYPDIFPEVKEAHILKRGKLSAEVHFVFHIITTINCHLKFTLAPTEIKWKLVKGDFMQTNDGGWKLEAKGKNKTHAAYTVEIVPSMWVPDAIIEDLIIKNAPNMLRNLKEKCEKKSV